MREQSNLESREAQEVRQRSEFLKQVVDFVEFMQKEHIADSPATRSLIVSATDDSVGDGKRGETRIITGNRRAATIALAGMMRDESFADIFHDARIMSGIVDDRVSHLPRERKRLRTMYALAALWGLWTLCIVALWVMGTGWMITVSNLLLMAVTGLNIFRDIRDRRERINNIKDEHEREHRERTYAMGQAFMEALQKHMRNMGTDDDDE